MINRNVLLVAINAKYIHSNLAVYSLKAFAGKKYSCVEIAEYTINQQIDEILMGIYQRKPSVVCFSCYIWNITYVTYLIRELGKLLPNTDIWLGGPEVSFDAEEILLEYPQVKGIMRGEGEETFLELLNYYHGEIVDLQEVDGITYREKTDKCLMVETKDRKTLDMSRIPFVYEDIEKFRNKIIYYESSRGCPFSCSYCLSSVDKCLRFRNLELVKRELQFFIDHEIPQVKFVDRTFNCNHKHALSIWEYLKEADKGKTNFHFEVAADLLNEEEIRLIQSLRPGLIQLEIGVQSTNPQTIGEIHRTMNFQKVSEAVKKIGEKRNVHQHLDLIAGLPYEDYESFRKSFCDVYALKPEQLQLGFLKVLKGSYMDKKKEIYELTCQNRPPYEVLSTKWISYDDVIKLKGIEEMVEVYYNSHQFEHTIERLEQEFSNAFEMFEQLSLYYEKSGMTGMSHTRVSRYEVLFSFICAMEISEVQKEEYRSILTFDLYLRENMKNRPAFAKEATVTKEEAAAFYDYEADTHMYLPNYKTYDKRQMRKMTHLEKINGEWMLFDYLRRNPLTNQAFVQNITIPKK